MAVQDNIKLIQMLQQMDMQEKQLAMQQARFNQQRTEYEQEQDRIANLVDAQQRGLDVTQQQLVGDPRGVFNINRPEDRAIIAQEDPEMLQRLLQNQMMESVVTPQGIQQAATLSTLQRQQASGGGGDNFGQMMRGMGTDLWFVAKEYNDGVMPTNPEQLNEMTNRAAADPDYDAKRTNWSNTRIANTLKSEGVSVTDPTMNVYTDKFGRQMLKPNAGSTLAQEFKSAAPGDLDMLDTYSSLDHTANELAELYDENLVGVFQGNINRLKSKFVDTPQYTQFKNIADRLRTIVYGFSGKQINETELEWLTGILPQIYNPDENFMVKVQEIQNWVREKHDRKVRSFNRARIYTGASPFRDEPEVSEEKLQAFRDKVDAAIGKLRVREEEQAGDGGQKRIRIKLGG